MSHDEELAAKGRIVTEYVDAKTKLLLLEEEARNHAEKLREIASVIGAGSGADRDLDLEHWFDARKVRELLRDLEQTRNRVQNLRYRVKQLGLELAD